MILATAKKSKPVQFDLTPLINIIFLILVFFMLAGSIKPDDLVQTARIESDTLVDTKLLIIVIASDGTVRIDGQIINDDNLSATLFEHRAEGGNVGVKPDARLQAERLIEITTLVHGAGYAELTLITRNP